VKAFVPVRIRLVTPISYLNQTSSRRAYGIVLRALAGSTATENRTKGKRASVGSNPINGSRPRAGAVMRSLNAALRGRVSDPPAANKRSPAAGFYRAFLLERRKHMKTETSSLSLSRYRVAVRFWRSEEKAELYHAFTVPEGYVVCCINTASSSSSSRRAARALGPKLHARRTGHTQNVPRRRRQEVLTADNIGVKLSLLVTYQVTDPVKASHETQSWQGDVYNAAQLASAAS